MNKGVLKTFAKFTGKTVGVSFLIKLLASDLQLD